MRGTRVLMVTLLALAAGRAAARTLVVPQDYASIQAAIDAGEEGDTVIVRPGTYVESIVFNGKNLVVRSEDPSDPDTVAATVLRAPSQKRPAVSPTTVMFVNGEGPAAVLSGFTITGGGGSVFPESPNMVIAGGILCVYASPTITMNVITGNLLPVPAGAGQSYGGAIACIESDAVITRNVLRGNSAYAGGAVFVQGRAPLIANNLIYDNVATAGGGACFVYGGHLANNTLIANQAEVGGNVYVVTDTPYSPCRIVSNILSDAHGSQGFYREGFHPEDMIAFNNVWSGAGSEMAWAMTTGDSSNISADPGFVDPAQRDYRLRMDSPCINAGDPESSGVPSLDAYGHTRIVHGRIDIGAAEYAGNLRPVARIADCPSTEQVPESVLLDGSASCDADGDEHLTYHWTQVLGPEVVLENADQPVGRFAPDTYGAFAFELVVGDGRIESLPARVEFVIGVGHVPVADAGRPAYATTAPVALDGSASTDPDASGSLSYSWKQVSGPALIVDDADSPRPTITGFTRTALPQWCKFELVVNDGQADSFPASVHVVVIPLAVGTTMRLENPSFDPNKPTVVYFGGGDCITGGGSWSSPPWMEKANVITWNYSPDGATSAPRYHRCGDILLGYLAQMAPDYRQPIQTMGHSTGGQPAIDAATYLNRVYRDARYAVNRVTFLDARCRDYGADVAVYLASAVDGEQCWIDSYEGTGPSFYPNVLNTQVAQNDHGLPPTWYKTSLTTADMNRFNHGVVGGAYWSVIGPGKNLQLAPTPGGFGYQFRWSGSAAGGAMGIFDEAVHPGRLPEPVTLVGPLGTDTAGEVMLSCKPSENAVRYELLLGADPYRVMDFDVVAEAEEPPDAVIAELPFGQTWWTIRAYDAYGSSIYADPIPLTAFSMSLPVENATQGTRYGFIQQAINEAKPGNEIVLNAGTYNEDLDFQGKALTLRSVNPDEPGAPEAAIIRGRQTVVTLSGANATLAGLTIAGGKLGILCSGANPTITRCRIVRVAGAGLELHDGASPSITRCVIADNQADGVAIITVEGGRATKSGGPTLAHCTVTRNGKAGIAGGKPTIANCIIYFNTVSITGAPTSVTYTDIEGGWSGPGNLDTNPQFAGNDDYHLKSAAGRWDPLTKAWVTDDVTSLCIDAGDPTLEVLDEPMPHGSRVNLGAYGATAEASKSP